jgi:ribosomal protein L11 methylase PrmA
MISPEWVVEGSSFRDPAGFVFYRDGTLYRQINRSHESHYLRLMESGLYDRLVDAHWLVPHREVEVPPALADTCFRVIQPERVPFLSYPYEWCFSQLKDAALLTLHIQKKALEQGMSLRDASAFNIQFIRGRPVLIDTLSLGNWEAGKPWEAYKQFCQHFLAPLMLMSRRDVRLHRLSATEIDGIPLTLARRLLGQHAFLHWSAFIHIYLHGRYDDYYGPRFIKTEKKNGGFGEHAFRGLIDSLESAVSGLTVSARKSEWLGYTGHGHNYGDASLQHKVQIVKSFLETCRPRELWDLGANTGAFSRMAAEGGSRVIAFDQDPHCVEANYLQNRDAGLDILPLILNLCNPTPAIGWQNEERRSLLQRTGADTVLALALIHHLAISNNLPLEMLAAFFARICRWLIIEFVPKEDARVQLLLNNRQDIFPRYTIDDFQDEFSRHFSIVNRTEIVSSKRTLFLMRRIEGQR